MVEACQPAPTFLFESETIRVGLPILDGCPYELAHTSVPFSVLSLAVIDGEVFVFFSKPFTHNAGAKMPPPPHSKNANLSSSR